MSLPNLTLTQRLIRGLVPRRFGVALALILCSLLPPITQAQGMDDIAPFIGEWHGTGITEDDQEIFFAMSSRDLDVRIWRTATGFGVEWTTIRRVGDPDAPDLVRHYDLLILEPDPEIPGRYIGATSTDPLHGGMLRWAALQPGRLLIATLGIDDSGAYEVARYERVLTAEGMELSFSRVRDGALIRTVRGLLTRAEEDDGVDAE